MDRTTHVTTISDVISGEDGLLNFTADEVPYDSVQATVGAPPLTAINVTGTVHWTQTAVGTVDFGTRTIAGGASIANSWPKPGAQLAGGWSVAASTAITGIDVTRIAHHGNAIQLREQAEDAHQRRYHVVACALDQDAAGGR